MQVDGFAAIMPATSLSGVPVITGFDWKAAQKRGSPALTPEEKQVLDLLAEGKSTPEIAKTLGTNRSAIWSKAKRIRKKFGESDA